LGRELKEAAVAGFKVPYLHCPIRNWANLYGHSEEAFLSPFTINPYLSRTAASATSTCSCQLHFLPQGWTVLINYCGWRG
jgi:hypothetical protein